MQEVNEDDKGKKGKESEEKSYMDPWLNPPKYVIDRGVGDYEVGESSNASASREGKGGKNKGKGKGKF